MRIAKALPWEGSTRAPAPAAVAGDPSAAPGAERRTCRDACRDTLGGVLAILLYHRVVDRAHPSVARYAVRPGRLRQQLRMLRAGGWVTVGPEAVLAARLGRTPLPRRAVWITFDDAYADFERHALPLLRHNGQTATLYVPTAHIGGTAAWLSALGLGDADAPLLDWSGLERVARAGVTLGSHAASHRALTELDDASLEHELVSSRSVLESRLGAPVRDLAYPHGAYDERVVAVAARAGYRTAVTTDWGLSADEAALALRRVFILGGDRLPDFLLRLRNGGDVRSVAARRLGAITRRGGGPATPRARP
jgi:peptidoglycan/xylan/chitin deacetylase (PgdA/CDA1 family)